MRWNPAVCYTCICTATFNGGGGGAILDIEANMVEGERVVRIQSNSLTTGAALEINATGNDMESSGRVIDIQASGQRIWDSDESRCK